MCVASTVPRRVAGCPLDPGTTSPVGANVTPPVIGPVRGARTPSTTNGAESSARTTRSMALAIDPRPSDHRNAHGHGEDGDVLPFSWVSPSGDCTCPSLAPLGPMLEYHLQCDQEEHPAHGSHSGSRFTSPPPGPALTIRSHSPHENVRRSCLGSTGWKWTSSTPSAGSPARRDSYRY